MAVDTRDKRFSMIGLCQPVPSVLPNPDGTIGTQDRAMFRWLYHGLTLSAAATITGRSINALLVSFRDKRLYVQ